MNYKTVTETTEILLKVHAMDSKLTTNLLGFTKFMLTVTEVFVVIHLHDVYLLATKCGVCGSLLS